MSRISTRLALLASMVVAPLALMAGCSQDNHSTATGQQKSKELTPNEGGPGGSGSISTEKVNAGGPGAPGTTAANPADK